MGSKWTYLIVAKSAQIRKVGAFYDKYEVTLLDFKWIGEDERGSRVLLKVGEIDLNP